MNASLVVFVLAMAFVVAAIIAQYFSKSKEE